MNWIIFALGAISSGAVSDLFRKLGSNLKDPFLSNLVFQVGSLTTAIILYLIFSRKIEGNSKGIMFALIGGVFISIFTTFSFKALSAGPDVSTVIPVIRIGVVILVVILGILLFKDKITWNLVAGAILATIGVYLISLTK
jgi:bacterial/archaeal transporter family protein